MKETKILFVGMFDSGKTTFIASLWDYINSDKTDKTITLSTLVNTENEYLDRIRGEWLQCKKVSRTYMINKTEKVEMKATKVKSGEKITLEIPDLSGELFNSHFNIRHWSSEFDELLPELSGIVLFINPSDEKNRTQFISNANNIQKKLATLLNIKPIEKKNKKEDKEEESDIDKVNFATWNENLTSNQVKLVENLQFLESRNAFRLPIKISLVISCWDLVDPKGKENPENWLEKHLPLLYQYLIANDQIFTCKFFGVSAQGCDYKDLKAVEAMQLLDPFQRVKVKEGIEINNDITSPIMWLTENETEN